MSERPRYLHARALQVAEAIVESLAPGCDRIAIAGSVRRQVAMVKDIEIVCIPTQRRDMFGDPCAGTELQHVLEDLNAENRLTPRQVTVHRSSGKVEVQQRMGDRYKALLAVRQQLPVDLFLVPDAAEWGGLMAIRTGPADYSRGLVTACQTRGLRCRGNVLQRVDTGEVIPTPEEQDFIRECGMKWLEPRDRR